MIKTLSKKKKLATQLMKFAAVAVTMKERTTYELRRKETNKRVYSRQFDQTEAALIKTLRPFFKDQIDSAIKKLRGFSEVGIKSYEGVKCGGPGGTMGPCPSGKTELDFNSLPKDVQKKISTTWWDSINPALRDGTWEKNDLYVEQVKQVDSLFKDHAVKISNPVQTIRGVTGKVYPDQAGETFTEKGYLRVLTDKDQAEGFTARKGNDGQLLMLTLPNGSKVLPGDHVREGELYLPRGATIKVTRVEKIENGRDAFGEYHFIEKIHAELMIDGQKSILTSTKASTATEGIDLTLSDIFNPDDWNDDLINRVLPVLAKAMAEASIAQYLELKDQIKRKKSWIGRKCGGPGGTMGPCPTGGNDSNRKLTEEFRQNLVGNRSGYGEPAKLYHGSDTVFSIDEMKPGKFGIFFSNNPGVAENQYGKVLVEAAVSLKNPKRLSTSKPIHDDELDSYAEAAKSSGHDGLIAPRVKDNLNGKIVEHMVVIAFGGDSVIPYEDLKKSILSSTKASTATEWLESIDDDDPEELQDVVFTTPHGSVRMGILTEYPAWMKSSIEDRLSETFSEPYWDDISKTTGGDINEVLRKGLIDGWSIEDMAKEMSERFGSDYPLSRGRLIARTESGNALNGARSAVIDQLISDLGMQDVIKKIWLSVLGNTTRDTHAHLDGVPADKDGCWALGGIRCRWPGDVKLPADERIQCQCTVYSSFGMNNDTADELIADAEIRQLQAGKSICRRNDFILNRDLELSFETKWSEFLVKCGGPGGTMGPCPSGQSSSSKTLTYHGTSAEFTQGISKNGIRPQGGAAGVAAYTTTSHIEAVEYGLSALRMKKKIEPGDKFAVVRVNSEGSEVARGADFGGASGSWHLFKDGVPPSSILGIDIYDAHSLNRHLRTLEDAPSKEDLDQFIVKGQDQKSSYVFVLIDSKKKSTFSRIKALDSLWLKCGGPGGTMGPCPMPKKDSAGKYIPGEIGKLAGVNTSSWKKDDATAQWALKKIALMEEMAEKGKWNELTAIGIPKSNYGKYSIAFDQAMQNLSKQKSDKLEVLPPPMKPSSDPTIATDQGWKKVGGKLGTEAGGTYEMGGKKFYVKQPEDFDRARNENLALKLYGLAGASAKESNLVLIDGKPALATEWVDSKKVDWNDPQTKAKAAEDFAVHVWLNNRDAVGAGSENPMDNIQQKKDGSLVMLDAGGSLEYKGMGGSGKKPFTDVPGEWDSFRDKSMNPSMHKVFGDMTHQQLADSAKKLGHITDDQINEMVSKFGNGGPKEKLAMAQTLIKRRDMILKVGKECAELAIEKQVPVPPLTAVKTTLEPLVTLTPKPIKASIPPPPQIMEGKTKDVQWYQNFQNKFNAIHAAAEKGDVEAVKAIKVSATSTDTYTKKVLAYKNQTLSALGAGGETIKPTTIDQKLKDETSKSPKEPIKIDPKKLPLLPGYTTSNKVNAEWNHAKSLELQKMAEQGDLVALKAEPTYKSPKLTQYKNDLIFEVATQLNPPPKARSIHEDFSQLSQHISGKPSVGVEKIGKWAIVGQLNEVKNGIPVAKWDHSSDQLHSLGYNAYEKMNQTQKTSLVEYTGGGYQAQNDSLREGKPSSSASATANGVMKNMIPLPEGQFLSRKHGGVSDWSAITPGTVISDRGMLSTSTNQNVWHGTTHLRLAVGPGVKGVPVDKFSENKGEKEVVLPPNQRIMVTRVESVKGQHTVYGVILPTQDSQCCPP